MFGKYLDNVRKESPLIHCITNYVTVNDVANAILACGASPIMADEEKEVCEITSFCGGLNINMGTISQKVAKSMKLASEKANKEHIPIVFDPVGASCSKFRSEFAKMFLGQIKPTVVKGNATEIKSLMFNSYGLRGVDVSVSDIVCDDNLDEYVGFIKKFSNTFGCITVITGAIDLVSDGRVCIVIHNGRKEMSSVTGTGCMLSGLITSFVASNKENVLYATTCAVCMMGLAGEIAYSFLHENEGNAMYRNRIIDAIYNMNSDILNKGERYEIR